MSGLALRALAATLGLTLIQALVSTLLPLSARFSEAPRFGLLALSNLFTAGVFLVVTRHFRTRGWRRVAVLTAFSFGIQANNLLEAFLFPLDIATDDLAVLFGTALAVPLALALLVDRMSGDSPASTKCAWPSRRGPATWFLRVAVCDLAYIVVYLAAGMLAWPFVKWFYEGQPMPALGAIVLAQAARGLVFVGLLTLLLRWLAVRPGTAALLCGLSLSILGGIAPLLLPNPFMPEAVRLPHLVEVGASNFLFGWFVAKVLGAASLREAPASAAEVATSS